MTEVKSALLVPLFLSFSFSRVQASNFIAPTICFALLTTTLGFLELYITKKKKRFCFFVAKTRWNQLYSIKSIFWFVCRKIVSLPVLLHLEKVFFQFAATHPGFLLHFTENNVFTCDRWRCFGILFLRTKLGFFEAYITKNGVFPFCRERHCNQFYSTTPYFGLFAVKLCCWQRYFIGKRFSSSFQRLTLAFHFILFKTMFLFVSG